MLRGGIFPRVGAYAVLALGFWLLFQAFERSNILSGIAGGALIIVAAGFLTFSLGYLGIGPGFLSRGWWLRWWILPDSFRVYSFFVTLMTLTLITHVGVNAILVATGASLVLAPRAGTVVLAVILLKHGTQVNGIRTSTKSRPALCVQVMTQL